ncbi:MAG TPA: hypothetical protein VGM29_19520 [Polyangiaceae bacterium]|jgi:hypothetical protein
MVKANSSKTRFTAGGAIGWVGGWVLSQYAGPSLWVPGGVMGVLLIVFAKTRFKPAQFAGAIAIMAGHLAWFLIAAVALGIWSVVIFDVLVLAGGLCWLWTKPSLVAALTVAAYELFSLVSNGLALQAAPLGSPEHKALTVHCLFRVLALGLLVVGYRRLRQPEPASSSAVDSA